MRRIGSAELFLVYQGYALEVTHETDAILADLYPRLDRRECYRMADSWLITCAPSRKPKNYRRFLINWLKRSQNVTLSNMKAWDSKERDLQVAINAGTGPRG